MLDILWSLLLVFSLLFAAFSGRISSATEAVFAAGEDAVSLLMGLCGLICLWMGLLRVAEAAGLVQSLGRMLSPLLRRLFPSVPKGHPAMGAIVMNVSANLLGLGNAATPMGLKAMALLQELNPDKEHASDAMQTLLALNTAAITLMPSMVIALRTAAASEDPAGILGATLLSSSMGMAFALLLDAVLRRRRR